MCHDSVAFRQNGLVFRDEQDVRVIVLVSYAVALALLLELLVLHRGQIAEQILLLRPRLKRRLIALHEDAAARALLHRLEAGALRTDYHANEIHRVSLRNLDALLEQLRVLKQAVDVREHAGAPVVVIGRCVEGQCVTLGD